LHIVVETVVQCQLAQGKTSEARRVYQALLDEGLDPHVARHALGYVLMHKIWLVLKVSPSPILPNTTVMV
jgi:hypothetical protein